MGIEVGTRERHEEAKKLRDLRSLILKVRRGGRHFLRVMERYGAVFIKYDAWA